MTTAFLPLFVEPEVLERRLGAPELLIVDMCRPEIYAQAHVPGAVHLDYAEIVAARPPMMGLLPEAGRLSETLGAVGLTPERHVVVYDDEGNGRAARLCWTLDVLGHRHYSLLNGSLQAWLAEHRRVSREPEVSARSRYAAHLDDRPVADKRYILEHLGDRSMALVDCRTPEEFAGRTARAARNGHIPGAVNFNWVNAMDQPRSLRLKPAADLWQAFQALGVTPEREVVTYCQTHHRSAHTYMVLRHLGYESVRGYPGSWSEWGNSSETPIE